MVVYKNFIVLFGVRDQVRCSELCLMQLLSQGFQDTGIKTRYLSDLWVFDLQSYKWTEIQQKDVERRPRSVYGLKMYQILMRHVCRARSGFSFVSCAEGAILHGGFCKEYEGKRVKGRALDDTWLLRLDTLVDSSTGSFVPDNVKWEKRKKVGYTPSIRSGTSMVNWTNKSTAVMCMFIVSDLRT